MTNDITPEESVAMSLVPWDRDDERTRYLGLRSCGFTIREALRLIGRAKSTLSLWRHNDEFVKLETQIPDMRRQHRQEYTNTEFFRNYCLVLEKDKQVLESSLYPGKDGDGKAVPMTKWDHEYLLKLRSHYTPQQLQVIEALIEGDRQGKGFDWSELFLTATRIQERVSIGVKVVPQSQIIEGEVVED